MIVRYNCGISILTKITKSKELEVSKETLLQTFVTNATKAKKDNDYLCQQINQSVRLQTRWFEVRYYVMSS